MAMTPCVKFIISAGLVYGPEDRLLVCGGASGSVQFTHTRCLTDAWKQHFLVLVACLLAGRLLSEGARESSPRQAITPARHDEGTLAKNHNANRNTVYYICRSFLSPRSHIAGSSPPSPLRYVPCIFIARRLQPFRSSTRVGLRLLPTLGALGSFSFFFFFFPE